MSEVYKIFAKDWEHLHDFSDEMLVELFNGESYGTPVSSKNGFALGKKWLNVTTKMWFEDLKMGTLFKCELYADKKFPKWWLDQLFKKNL